MTPRPEPKKINPLAAVLASYGMTGALVWVVVAAVCFAMGGIF